MCLTLYFVRPSFTLDRLGQLLHHGYKTNVNIIKVYIERNNLQVELIRYHKKC